MFSRASVAIRPFGGDAEQVDGEVITAGYLETLRVAPAIGQTFAPEDDTAGRPVVLLSDGLWRRRFGADPAVPGRAV